MAERGRLGLDRTRANGL